MLAVAESIIHEHEAILGQVEFLKEYASTWKVASTSKETDKKALIQLILTVDYLKEGLENLFGRIDNFILHEMELSVVDGIKLKHKAIVDSLNKLHRSLIDLSSNVLLMNKEYISQNIDDLYHIISMLSIRESEILKFHVN